MPEKPPRNVRDGRPYVWEPFKPGNTAYRQHGAQTEREIAPLAEELAAEVVDLAPWVGRPQFAPGVRRWARSEAIASKLWDYIAEHGPLDDFGIPRPALTMLDRWEASAAHRGAALGLDPAGMAKLLGSLALSAGNENAAEVLNALRAEGRRLVEGRTDDQPDQPPGDQPDDGAT